MTLRFARLIVGTLCLCTLAGYVFQPDAAGRQKDVTIGADDQTTTVDCNGNGVTVRGRDNTLTIRGNCNKLTVDGDDNTIRAAAVKEVAVNGQDNTIVLETVAKITATGNDNSITWRNGPSGKAPEISNKGNDNRIAKAGP